MITLTVISLNGAPFGGALSARFDELGGSIGRADTNQLVLPDPDRAISRVHAQVVYRAGAWGLVDRGSNPVLVNGQPVGSGREVPIKAGDKVQIGGFLLDVKQSAAPAASRSDDPFADLLGPGASTGIGTRAPGASSLVDPLASFGDSRLPDLDPPRAAPRGASAPSAAGGIPDDWDPFAPDPVARPAPVDFAQSLGRPGHAGSFGLEGGAAAPAALIPELSAKGPGNDNSLDALFGLKPGGGGDPLANSALDAPMSAPNMAASHDPLKSLGAAPLASAQTAQDDSSELHSPYQPPPVVDRAPPPTIPAGAVLSWDAPEGDGRTVIRPSARAATPEAAPAFAPMPAPPVASTASQMPASPLAPSVAPPVAAMPAPAYAPSVASMPSSAPSPSAASIPSPAYAPMPAPAGVSGAAGADTAALLAAFRDGLAVPDLKVDALTPELMRLIGQLLHESAKGTVDLLVARAALKREVRAEGTMIVAQKNNPLKFSPSAEVALAHLLAPPMRGFMDAAPAMRDAYDDLRAHQFGFIAGMKAALAGVLDRFRPSELEGRLTQRSGLRSLLPGSRKAAMWEVFTEHYAQISTEAEDDFHSLFGKAFLKAYEEHIAQLRKDQS